MSSLIAYVLYVEPVEKQLPVNNDWDEESTYPYDDAQLEDEQELVFQ